jgi:DNA end-binding protein Ku
MKPIWKGSIAFGLVNIPVRLYSATESQGLASHMLYKKDLSRIRFQRVAESTGKEVPAAEIVKGYEVEKDQYVILSDEELGDVAPERMFEKSHTGAIRFSIRRIAARSIIVSEVCTRYS